MKNHSLALEALISSHDSNMEPSGITLNELRDQLMQECSKEMGENAEEEKDKIQHRDLKHTCR